MSVKKKIIKDNEMSKMFNEMLGTGSSVNMQICYPKYIEMRTLLSNCLDLLDAFGKSPIFNDNFQAQERKDILAYVAAMRQTHTSLFSFDFSEAQIADFRTLGAEEHEAFS